VALAIFKSYQNPRAIIAAAGLMIPFSLPFTAVFSVIMNDVAYSDVVNGSWLVPVISLATVLLSFSGCFLGRAIGRELRKAGKL
jgi:ABC-type Na+ efflux pump permease subunit